MLVSAYFGIKGSLFTCLHLNMLPYFKLLGVNGDRYQSFRTLSITPWSLKPLIGTISDTTPLFGYHKRWYIAVACLGGVVSFVVLIFADVAPAMGAILFMLAHFQP